MWDFLPEALVLRGSLTLRSRLHAHTRVLRDVSQPQCLIHIQFSVTRRTLLCMDSHSAVLARRQSRSERHSIWGGSTVTPQSSPEYPRAPAIPQVQEVRRLVATPPRELPPLPALASASGMPAARRGDRTSHGGTIGPGGAVTSVLIGGQPAATAGDPHICPMFDGPKPHVGGIILTGSNTVFICQKPAARVGDLTECKGLPGAVGPQGCPTVLIGG
jgi:uncharacterized Zn-binding protein involved in type VI secretion